MRLRLTSILFAIAAICGYVFIASIRFLPLSCSKHFIASPIGDIKRLYFPELKGNCFNPSIVNIEDGYLLSFRWDKPDKHLKNLLKTARWASRKTYVCLVELDRELNPKSSVQILDLVNQENQSIVDPTDMRIIRINDEVTGIFNTVTSLPHHPPIIRLYTVNLKKDPLAQRYVPEPCQKLIYPNAREVEKNWTPFVWNDELYFVYEISPHTILKVNRDTGVCELLEKQNFQQEWTYGSPRGGTPAISYKNLYVSFFHSAERAIQIRKHKACYYLMGCYAFQGEPPFHVKALTPKPILSSNLYSFRHNRRKILYPSGVAENKDQFIVACGENDEHIVIVSIDKSKMIQELKDIQI